METLTAMRQRLGFDEGRAVPEGRVELPWVAPAHFECAAYAISPLRQDEARTIVADEAGNCEQRLPVLSLPCANEIEKEKRRKC